MICAECLLSEATCTLYGLQNCANAAGKAMKWLDARTQKWAVGFVGCRLSSDALGKG